MASTTHQVDQSTSQPSSPLDPNDPLGLLTEEFTDEPVNYPPLFGSHPVMPSRHSAQTHTHSRGVTSDSEISHLDLSLSSEASQASPSHSQAESSRPRVLGGTRRGHEGNTRPRNRPSPGLHIDIPPRPQPLRAEDLQSEAVTSDSTTYQNGHSHLLANRARRHNEMIETAGATAILDPLRDTIPAELREVVYDAPEETTGVEHRTSQQQPTSYRSEPSSYQASEQHRPHSQRSSSEQSSIRSRHPLADDLYNVAYGYGFEGQRNTNESTSRRTGPTTTFFEDTLFALRSSSPVYSRETSILATRPDIHNSMAPFQGVDPDFAQYQAVELARYAGQTQTESSPALSELSSVISFDSRDYEV